MAATDGGLELSRFSIAQCNKKSIGDAVGRPYLWP